MAKKTVASIQKGEGRTYSKIIIMERSPKHGYFLLKSEMLHNDYLIYDIKYVYYFSDNPHKKATD